MISYLKGTIISIASDSVILSVQGVGYHVLVGNSILSQVQLGQEADLYAHMHVREDILQLFGFTSKEELDVFKQLISVSGIGPKTGIAMLETASINDIVTAVHTEDHVLFTTVPGIGAKTAKRLIIDLKNKFHPLEFTQSSPMASTSSSVRADLLAAMEGLGYASNEVLPHLGEMELHEMDLDKALKEVLKRVSS